MDKSLQYLFFSKKGKLRITKNYRGIVLASAGKVYNTLQIRMVFQGINLQPLRFWLFIKSSYAKNLKALDSTYRNIEQILLSYGLHIETITPMMIYYKNMKAMAH